MDFIAGVFVGALGWAATWYGLLTLVLLGMAFAKFERNWLTAFTIVATAYAASTYFGMTVSNWYAFAAGYLVAGVMWSFWRYRCWVKENLANMTPTEMEKDYLIKRLSPSENKSRIAWWVLNWPLSAVANVLADAIDFVTDFVSTFFKGVYAKIFNDLVDSKKNETRDWT